VVWGCRPEIAFSAPQWLLLAVQAEARDSYHAKITPSSCVSFAGSAGSLASIFRRPYAYRPQASPLLHHPQKQGGPKGGQDSTGNIKSAPLAHEKPRPWPAKSLHSLPLCIGLNTPACNPRYALRIKPPKRKRAGDPTPSQQGESDPTPTQKWSVTYADYTTKVHTPPPKRIPQTPHNHQ